MRNAYTCTYKACPMPMTNRAVPENMVKCKYYQVQVDAAMHPAYVVVIQNRIFLRWSMEGMLKTKL